MVKLNSKVKEFYGPEQLFWNEYYHFNRHNRDLIMASTWEKIDSSVLYSTEKFVKDLVTEK